MSELLPCPFCGGCCEIIKGQALATGTPIFKVYCPDCQIRTAPELTKEESIKEWNTRHIPEGYVLVPVEPTDRMERAVMRLPTDWGGAVNPFGAYKAMIAAAQDQDQ